jgi:hypothetical protein
VQQLENYLRIHGSGHKYCAQQTGLPMNLILEALLALFLQEQERLKECLIARQLPYHGNQSNDCFRAVKET